MLGCCLCRPSGYGGLVIVIIEVVQVVKGKGTGKHGADETFILNLKLGLDFISGT